MDNLTEGAAGRPDFAFTLVPAASIISGCWVAADPVVRGVLLLVSSLHMYCDAMEDNEDDDGDYYSTSHGLYKDPYAPGVEEEKGPAE